jgi:predicted RNase H-like HicB family nuclease
MNTDYEIVIYREDDVWVAQAPELRGCATHADTREEALARLLDLIPRWIEACRESGAPVPEPKGRFAFA